MNGIRHGTIGAYTNRACRCAECRRAWTAYNLALRRARTERGICVQCPQPRSDGHVRCRVHHEAMLLQSRDRTRRTA